MGGTSYHLLERIDWVFNFFLLLLESGFQYWFLIHRSWTAIRLARLRLSKACLSSVHGNFFLALSTRQKHKVVEVLHARCEVPYYFVAKTATKLVLKLFRTLFQWLNLAIDDSFLAFFVTCFYTFMDDVFFGHHVNCVCFLLCRAVFKWRIFRTFIFKHFSWCIGIFSKVFCKYCRTPCYIELAHALPQITNLRGGIGNVCIVFNSRFDQEINFWLSSWVIFINSRQGRLENPLVPSGSWGHWWWENGHLLNFTFWRILFFWFKGWVQWLRYVFKILEWRHHIHSL